jgi:hypothetical protein
VHEALNGTGVMHHLEALGARQVAVPHDEGFGMVAAYEDPEGNPFEIIELEYDFGR